MDSLTSTIAELDAIMHGMLMLTLYGSIIVLVVVVVQLLFSRKLSAKWMYALWILAIARFALFIAPSCPASFQNWTSFNPTASVPVAITDSEITTSAIDGQWTINDAPNHQVSALAQTSFNPFSLFNCLALVWIVGCLFLLTKLYIAYRRLQQVIANSAPAPVPIQQILHQSQQWTNYSADVELKITRQIDAPAATGLLKPVIMLPHWCVDELNTDQIRCILIHELIHLKRKDIWIQLAAHLVYILHWFNPLVLLATRKLDVHREMACDQRSTEVLTKFNVNNPTQLYGTVILSVATGGTKHSLENRRVPHSVLVGSFVNFNQQQIKQRIAMLVQSQPRKIFTSLLAVVGILTMLAVGFTSAQTTKEAKQAPEPTQEDSTAPEPVVGDISEQIILDVKIIKAEKGTLKKLLKEQNVLNASSTFEAMFHKNPQHNQLGVTYMSELESGNTLLKSIATVANGKSEEGVLLLAPKLITSIGREAQILSGREIPVKTTNSDGENTVEFKQYGLSISLTPQKSNEDNHMVLIVKSKHSRLHDSTIGRVVSNFIRSENSTKIKLLSEFQTGFDMEFGNTLAIYETYHDTSEKEIVTLITPTKVIQP